MRFNLDKKRIQKIAIIFGIIALIASIYLYNTNGIMKSAQGELMDVNLYPCYDGNYNCVIIFNVSGNNKYIVMDIWETGKIAEINSQVNHTIRITFKYLNLQNKNSLIDYEVIN